MQHRLRRWLGADGAAPAAERRRPPPSRYRYGYGGAFYFPLPPGFIGIFCRDTPRLCKILPRLCKILPRLCKILPRLCRISHVSGDNSPTPFPGARIHGPLTIHHEARQLPKRIIHLRARPVFRISGPECDPSPILQREHGVLVKVPCPNMPTARPAAPVRESSPVST